MDWNTMFQKERQPSPEEIAAYIESPLWQEFLTEAGNIWGASPRYGYSSCAMQPGWNVKLQKNGRALCTLYPMEGFFIALVVVGAREAAEAEVILPSFTPHMQKLYEKAAVHMGGRWLMAEVRDRAVMENVLSVMKIRVPPKTKK